MTGGQFERLRLRDCRSVGATRLRRFYALRMAGVYPESFPTSFFEDKTLGATRRRRTLPS